MFENGRIGVYVVLDGDGRLLVKGEVVVTGDKLRYVPSAVVAYGLPDILEVAFPPLNGLPDVWVSRPILGHPINVGMMLEIPSMGRDDYVASIHIENGCKIKPSLP
jgi:hypothetical protein